MLIKLLMKQTGTKVVQEPEPTKHTNKNWCFLV
jgi:hypothetical protein